MFKNLVHFFCQHLYFSEHIGVEPELGGALGTVAVVVDVALDPVYLVLLFQQGPG